MISLWLGAVEREKVCRLCRLILHSCIIMGCFCTTVSYANIPSKGYVDDILSALSGNVSVSNPHKVTASQVGLGNVKNVDQTNANNLSSGTVAYDLLPVGTDEQTVAAGDDARFDTISTVAPTGTPPPGRVYIWFN